MHIFSGCSSSVSIVNTSDVDDDNDGIADWLKSGAFKMLSFSSLRIVGARMVGEVGVNGMLVVFESPLDTGKTAYTLENTDVNEDDIPDFQDLDRDYDGISDIIELGGSDSDSDGQVDNFVYVLRGQDGTDDGLPAFPYKPRDANRNVVFDHVEYIPSGNTVDDDETVDVVPDVVGMQLQTGDPQAADEASQGVILSGLNASGCSIASSASNSLLYLLTIISIAMLGRRYTLRRRSTPN